eukprot:scaffold674_cov130-Amphora_coffeaeformis.AAC.7
MLMYGLFRGVIARHVRLIKLLPYVWSDVAFFVFFLLLVQDLVVQYDIPYFLGNGTGIFKKEHTGWIVSHIDEFFGWVVDHDFTKRGGGGFVQKSVPGKEKGRIGGITVGTVQCRPRRHVDGRVDVTIPFWIKIQVDIGPRAVIEIIYTGNQ